jgi:hypothetical protein
MAFSMIFFLGFKMFFILICSGQKKTYTNKAHSGIQKNHIFSTIMVLDLNLFLLRILVLRMLDILQK